jgi:hypothetical protein
MKLLVGTLVGLLFLGAGNLAGAQTRDPADVDPDKCPAPGTAKSVANKALNILKNREVAPRADQMNQSVTLEKMLAPGNDRGRFDHHTGATIVGWVINVEQGGHPETANCGSMSLDYTDTHITVGLDPQADLKETLVVEVTPRWRKAMAAQGIDWRTETLQQTLKGKKVKFSGWLMFDLDHRGEAVNTAPRNPKDWRKTIWEIHPITSIEIVE